MLHETLFSLLQKQSPKFFCKKGDLRNFAKFTGKHLCQSYFSNKVAGLRPETLLNKRLWYKCFSVNFAKLLRTPLLTEYLRWLLLLLDKIQNIKKMNHENRETKQKHENRKKRNLKKGKRNRVSCFNIYIIVFAFLSSTVEVGRW